MLYKLGNPKQKVQFEPQATSTVALDVRMLLHPPRKDAAFQTTSHSDLPAGSK